MLELEHGFRIIDVHARLEPPDDRPLRRYPITPEQLEREMQQAGITTAVVFPGPRDDGYLRANNAVARYSVDRPFVAFARINGPRDPTNTPLSKIRNLTASPSDHHVTRDDIEQYAYDDRFAGFKLNPVADGLPGEDVLDQLDDVNLPVIVHGGDGFPPPVLEETILRRSFPVIVAHFGGYPLRHEYMTATIELLADHDECYVDTSSVRFRDVLERAMREHPDRVLFGSGVPDIHPTVAVMELLALDIPEDAMRKAFSKNADRVFHGILAAT